MFFLFVLTYVGDITSFLTKVVTFFFFFCNAILSQSSHVSIRVCIQLSLYYLFSIKVVHCVLNNFATGYGPMHNVRQIERIGISVNVCYSRKRVIQRTTLQDGRSGQVWE
jgi:hypothetical protein